MLVQPGVNKSLRPKGSLAAFLLVLFFRFEVLPTSKK
jgi:hypothetical protein